MADVIGPHRDHHARYSFVITAGVGYVVDSLASRPLVRLSLPDD